MDVGPNSPRWSRARRGNTWENGSAARTGAANAWSVIVADEQRGLVFIPTGSASPDYYGGERKGANLFANSIVALRADTGKMVWSFQTVHHDLWDYDVASPPLLFDVRRNGKAIPAVAVGSKTGNLFILNRETGKPIFGVDGAPRPADGRARRKVIGYAAISRVAEAAGSASEGHPRPGLGP